MRTASKRRIRGLQTYLPDETLVKLRAGLAAGHSLRAVASFSGVSRSTARKFAKVFERGPCGCGKPAGHQGWCSVRFRRSPARQAVLRRLHGNTAAKRTRPEGLSAYEATMTRDDRLERYRRQGEDRMAELRRELGMPDPSARTSDSSSGRGCPRPRRG